MKKVLQFCFWYSWWFLIIGILACMTLAYPIQIAFDLTTSELVKLMQILFSIVMGLATVIFIILGLYLNAKTKKITSRMKKEIKKNEDWINLQKDVSKPEIIKIARERLKGHKGY